MRRIIVLIAIAVAVASTSARAERVCVDAGAMGPVPLAVPEVCVPVP